MTSKSENSLNIAEMNEICDSNIDEDIFLSFEKDLLSDSELSSEEASQKLEMFLKKYQKDEPNSLCTFLKKSSASNIRPLVVDLLKTQITSAVMKNKDSASTIFTLTNCDDEDFSFCLLAEACEALPKDVLKKLLCDVIIPEMFNLGSIDKDSQDMIINLAFHLIKKFPITNLSNQEVKLFTSKLSEKYVKVLEKLREQNYSRWHDLWMFLIRFSAKHLHSAMDLANKLLRVVEFAFRNPSYEQRLKGYECWKELIDNASLDMNHMCSSKQIKLLVTPLRAKFSKMEVVICKRFEVFLYLLEKLQNQSILCLNEFLEFCFGVTTNIALSSKNGQGKLVPNLWLKSIEVFLAILGDQKYIFASLQRNIFEKTIINEKNIANFKHVIICSVIESSIILKHISIDVQKKVSILFSLWESLFNIVLKSSKELQEKCFQIIFSSMNGIFKEFNEDLTYVGMLTAFVPLLESNIDYRLISDAFKLLVEKAVRFLIENNVCEELLSQFSDVMQTVCQDNHLTEFVFEQIKKVEVIKNKKLFFQMWSTLGAKMIGDLKNHKNIIVPFFLWPVRHLEKFDDELSTETCAVWIKLYVEASNTSDDYKKLILTELQRSFMSNPLLSSNISNLISTLSCDELTFDEQYVSILLKLMANIMAMPLLPQDCAKKMVGVLVRCIGVVASLSGNDKGEVDLTNVDNICECIEKLPVQEKKLAVLEELDKLVDKMVSQVSSTTAKRVKNLISTFSGPALSKRASKIAMRLNTPESSNGHSPGGTMKRSVRMTHMVIEKPHEPVDKINSLQFFGKDVEQVTPVKLKGSLLQTLKSSSPSSRSKKMVNAIKKRAPEPPSLEDNTNDFVVIDTEVKLEKDKLTEHQKEELKRRREDIPALYQDLSQSQSHTQSSNSSKSPSITLADSTMAVKDSNPIPPISTEEVGHFTSVGGNMTEKDTTVDAVSSVGKKKSKTKDAGRKERELLKIQMDIVGGDTFLQGLPSKRPRRSITLAASKQKKGDQKSENEAENEDAKNVDSSRNLEQPLVVLNDIAEKSPEDFKETDGKDSDKTVDTPTSSTSFYDTDSSKADTPNNRKNKFIKPKKFISTGSKSKIKIKLSGKGMLVKKKRPIDDGTSTTKNDQSKDQSKDKVKRKEEAGESKPKHKTKVKTESEDERGDKRKPDEEKEKSQGTQKAKTQESEILFASELDSQKVKTNKKRNEEAAPNTTVPKTEIPSKRPKEIMKKNKEKVKTIQSQLKLANLGDLSTSSEPKKAKSAKLIFIREITNSTNGQDTKVAAAGLKRNKDNKSKNIAYTIERPATPVPLSSLNLLEPIEAATQAEQEESDKKSERLPSRKRKKTTSESDASVSSSNSSCGEGTPKRRRSKSKTKVDDHKEVGQEVQKDRVPIKPEVIVETSSSMATPRTSKDNRPKQSEKILSPADSPSRILRSRSSVASPLSKDGNTEKLETSKAVKSLFTESEDVIESSQDSLADKSSFSIGNLSRSLTKFGVKDVVDEPKKTDEDMTAEPPMANVPIVSQADTETCDSNYESHPPVVQLEVPTKPELTKSEILLSLTETVSLVSPQFVEENMDTSSDFKLNLSAPEVAVPKDIEGAQTSSGTCSDINSTPKKLNEDLPGSPVSNVTPTLTKELLDNTLDISPINLHTATNESAKQNCEEKLDEMFGNRKSTSEEEPKSAVFSSEPKMTGELFQKNLRSTKLLNMVNVETPVTNVETPVTQKKSGKRILTSPAPMKSRYEKLFSFFDGNKQDDKCDLKESDDSAGKENEEDLLTFSREVPSPFATPSTSILKRKLVDTDDTYSPCAKRKRVNFSYPCISSTKLYIRHKEEMIPHFRMSFPQNFMGMDLDDENSDEDDPFAYHRPGEEIGTEESLELTNPLLLCGKKPIYEQLTDCTETLGELWKRLSSPMYCEVLKKVLQDKDIHTVGDLAQLTESEINRLPFKQPRIKTVRKALNYYYNTIYKKAKRNVELEDAAAFDSKETSREIGAIGTEIEENDTETSKVVDTHKPLDIRDEFANILKRMKDEKQPLEEFGTVFLDLVDESEVVSLLRTVYNTDFRRFFERSHWEFIIRSIVQSGGVSDLFDIISDLAENNTLLANQLEKIVQLRVTQNPLSDIIKKRTLVDLRDGISECVRDEVFQREDVLKTCLLPLVKDPKDIRIYFNTLTIVQINELFVERIQPSELGLLFEQLNEHYGNYTIAQHVNKNDVLKICSGDDLVNSIVEKKNVVESIKQLISKIEDKSELTGLYNYIGELLPVKSRIDSHISFLRILASDNPNVE